MTPKHWDAFRGHSERASAYLAGYYEGRCAEMERTLDRESSFARILRDLAESREAEEPEPVEVGPQLQAEINRLKESVTQKAVEIETRKDEREGRRKSGWPRQCNRCRATRRTFIVCVDGEWWYECAECGELSQKLPDTTRWHYGLQNAEPEPEIEATPENLAEVAK